MEMYEISFTYCLLVVARSKLGQQLRNTNSSYVNRNTSSLISPKYPLKTLLLFGTLPSNGTKTTVSLCAIEMNKTKFHR